MPEVNCPQMVTDIRRRISTIGSSMSVDEVYTATAYVNGWIDGLRYAALIDHATWNNLCNEAKALGGQRIGWLESVIAADSVHN